LQNTSSVFLTAHYMPKFNPDSLFKTYFSFWKKYFPCLPYTHRICLLRECS